MPFWNAPQPGKQVHLNVRTNKGTNNELLTLNIDNVPNLVVLEVCGQMLDSALLVAAREHVSGAAAVSCWVHHLSALSSI